MIIEVFAIVGLDPTSIHALENLQKAAEVLKGRYGVKLVIIPFNTWSNNLEAALRSLPTIFIGGIKAFSGYAPSVGEVVDFVLNYIKHGGHRYTEELVIPAGVFENDSTMFSAATI